MKNVHIVVQEPTIPGNCGAIARVMKNFGFTKLVFLNPLCDYLSEEGLNRAKHAKDVLQNAIVVKEFDDIVEKFDYVIGTTAMIGTDYNIPRTPVLPEDLSKKINTKNSYAIIIGREGEGMNNEEILKCDFTVTIPSSKNYPTLNISHALGIVCYELFKNNCDNNTTSHIKMLDLSEKKVLLDLIDKTLDNLEFSTKGKKDTQKRLWKRIIGKSNLSKREAFALCGFFKKVQEK